MKARFALAISVSALATIAAGGAPAAAQVAPAPGVQDEAVAGEEGVANEIVVTGIRGSLERAAAIKQQAVQVVDSIVAQDIGKLPDPTTADALQRVPGIQVSITRNNELGDVRVRGLPDILTTVNGREVFTTTGRNFDLQDVPAGALAKVDVYKSQTANLTEGGLAGVIDLALNRPFNFRNPTAVFSARGNYAILADEINPQFGALLTDRWDTGIGEIGVLLNGTFSRSEYYRATTVSFQRRSAATAPFGASGAGMFLPGILQNFPQEGFIERHQANAAIQWQATPELEAYAEGFYTYFRDRGSRNGANIQPFTTGTTIQPGSVKLSDRCILTRVRNNNGNNPVVQVDAAGNQTLTPYNVQTLCEAESITFNNLVANQTTQARDLNQKNQQIAGGLKYESGRLHAVLDAAYQTSRFQLQNITSDIGQRIPYLTLLTDVDGHASYTVPDGALLSSDNLVIRNALIQNFTVDEGDLLQVKADVDYDFDSFLKNIAVGVRYARRSADSRSVNLNKAAPGGNIGTGNDAAAIRVLASGLPAQFLAVGSIAPDLNGGSRFLVPNPDFLLSESGLDALRTYFGLATGQPAFDPRRAFDATENTIAAYAQGEYEINFGGSATIDGVVGMRYIKTDRTIGTNVAGAGGVFDRLTADTSDTDWLPNATARLRFDNGLQFRAGYAKSLRRPNFGSLNPAITLNSSNNPLVQSTGNAGNPDLRAQKSTSFDATAEYYFRGGYIAVAGYYRDITDRVITSGAVENYGGVDYNVSRPRNVGEARLSGVELSGQYFFDFLPGALSGLGVQGAFTYADSEIGGDDPLAGYALQGVSKYNYTAGLLYEKHGVSGRLVYTHRSSYFDTDASGEPTIRPFTAENVNDIYVPPLVTYQRPGGRLDFNIGYDLSEVVRIDFGGTNILGQNSSDYYNYPGFDRVNNSTQYDETTYSVGVRVRL